ncbi:non-ribosomal peptide synthetase [Bacillus bombysepticus]|uniref:Carrier domain-containing protein n=1 Tax=Bacillus bombysepticus str. Wang TaxID=1330043 RepID=A0A9W3LI49_9BACI|nr:non-ribosomal peptide synthetase [Bacillus bombysepticus]AHX21957.1 hypothetical protein CY96_27980 [Bacillus bombysepticus str. Wang]
MNKELINLNTSQKKALLKELMAKKQGNLYPLTYQQSRLWFFNELEKNKQLYNIPYVVNMDGKLDVKVLTKSINHIINRHYAMRTKFIEIQDKPWRKISNHIEVDVPFYDLSKVNNVQKEIKIKQLLESVVNHTFDLNKGPLFKFLLIKQEMNRHILVLNFHHIVSDGTSLKIFFNELQEIYTNGVDDSNTKKILLNIQEASNELNNIEYQDKMSYWKNKLSKANFLLNLPLDQKRPPEPTYDGKNFLFEIPSDIKDELVKISNKCNTTLYTVILSVFGILLNKYTKQEEILIGSPVSLRNSKELEKTMGFFVNTVVMKCQFKEDMSYIHFLQKTRYEVLDSLDNKDIPFEKIVEELNIKRDSGYNPIFQVMFSYESVIEKMSLGEIIMSPKVVNNNISKFDLTLNIYETNSGLCGDFEYNTSIFKHETIKRMSKHFLNLLKEIIANPQKKLGKLNLLDRNEEQELLTRGNHYIESKPLPLLHDLISDSAISKSDQIAIFCNEESLTYIELEKRSNQLAHYLLSQGVGNKTLVGIYMDKSIETFISIAAILKVGGAYVPLDPSYPLNRTAYMIENSNLSVIVTKEMYLKKILDYDVRKICLDTENLTVQPENKLNIKIQPDQPAYVIYTSGTTGKPKGVLVEHKSMASVAQAWLNDFKLNDFSVRLLQMANQSFDVFTGDFIKTIISGGTLIVCPEEIKIDFYNLYRFIIKHQISIVESTPALIVPFMDYLIEKSFTINSVKMIIIGSDILLASDYQRLIRNFGANIKIINSYGVTEATIDSTYFYHEDGKKELRQITNTPIGKPLSNSKTYILDERMQLQATGLVGELYIGGAPVSRGYLNNIELTNQKFINSPFNSKDTLYKTGDLAKWNTDNDLEIIGRSDGQVKIGGYRVELGEIEEMLKNHPLIVDAAVVYKVKQKRLDAFIVNKEDSILDSIAIKDYLKNILPYFMIPSKIVNIKEIPQTSNGKIDKKLLENTEIPNEEHTQKKNEFQLITEALPRTIIEYEIQQIWKEVIGLENIRLRDNFFEIGGSSILLVQLLSKVRKKYGVEVALSSFYRNATIEELAVLINNKNSQKENSFITCIKSKGDKVPIFVFHQTGGHWFRYLELIKHLGENHPVYGLGICNPYGDSDNLIEIASQYIKEIKKVQPKGPYVLIGHSFGGNIAFEIALQLQKAGEEIGHISLLDTYLPPYKTEVDDFELILDYMERYNLNDEDVKKFRLMNYDEKLKYIINCDKKYGYLPLDIDLSEMDRILSVNLKLHRALFTYQKPRRLYKGNIYFFRAIKEEIDSSIGWKEHIEGKVLIHEINSTHSVMLTEPYIIQIANLLEGSISNL